METFSPREPQVDVPELSGYDPVRLLGEGSQGQVWLMVARHGGRRVAAKLLKGGADAAETLQGVRHNESEITREWRALAQLSHEHLLPTHGVLRDAQGRHVLLTEFAAGGSLRQVVAARGPLSVGETVTVLTPLGQLLAYLHNRGAVHGDLTPANVLLTAAGKPLLGDLGVSRLLGQQPGAVAGTPGFYCPTDTERDPAADVFSLAAVGWFALTGHPPPVTSHRMAVGALLREVPGDLLAALEAGLSEDPLQRPTAAALAQAVFRSARAEHIMLGNAVHPSVLPELPTRRNVTPRRRHAAAWRRFSGRAVRRRRLSSMWGSRPLPGARARSSRAGWGLRLRIIGATALAAACCAVVALALNGAGPQAPLPLVEASRTVQPAVPSWLKGLPEDVREGLLDADPLRAVPALAWARSYAISQGSQEILAHVNAGGSAAARQDAALLAELRRRGHTLSGWNTEVRHAALANDDAGPAGAAQVSVLATVTSSQWVEQDGQGNVVFVQTAAQEQKLLIDLAKEEGLWQVLAVRAPKVEG